MISFLTTVNTPPVILNIGYRDDTRFKNDIFIEPQYSELEDLYSKTQHLGKAEPIFIHCTGGGHTASMIAQMLAKEGYSDLNVLAFTPESLMSTMQSRGLRVEDFFVQEENSQETKAIIRISLKANANLLHERDSFFFYKVKNCQEYINLYSFLNSGNSICSSDFDPDFLNEKEAKTHFLCAQVGDCTYLQAVLQNTDSTHIGYLVLLYE